MTEQIIAVLIMTESSIEVETTNFVPRAFCLPMGINHLSFKYGNWKNIAEVSIISRSWQNYVIHTHALRIKDDRLKSDILIRIFWLAMLLCKVVLNLITPSQIHCGVLTHSISSIPMCKPHRCPQTSTTSVCKQCESYKLFCNCLSSTKPT